MKKLFQFDFKTRHAGISTLTTIAVLAALVILNILLGETDIQADLTPKKLFSLTEETEELLNRLDSEVEILALYGPGEEPESIMETINEYNRLSALVAVSVIDPDRSPALVARFSENEEVIPAGSFIVSSGTNYRVLGAADLYEISYGAGGQAQVLGQKVEQQITAAIAYVSSGHTPKIYEIIGHRETPLASAGFADLLTQANYVSEELSLVRSNIPADAALVTIIGPRSDISPAEAEKVEDYLAGGGRLFIAIDYSPEPYENLYSLLSRWDLEVRRGLVLELEQNRLLAEFGDNPLVSAPYLTDHESLSALAEAKTDPVFQASMGFSRTKAEQRKLEYFPLLRSSDQSLLRTDFGTELASRMQSIPGDEPGPIDLAAAVRQRNLDTYEPEGAVIVALGSALTVGGLSYVGHIKANVDLVMSLINWAVGDDSTVSIPSKSLYRLPLRIGNATGMMYAVIAIIVIPLGCILAGLVIWLKRRNR